MNLVYDIPIAALLLILTLAAYVDRIYSEMGKFLVREYQDNIDSWTRAVEPRLRLGRESIVLSASVLRQLSVASIALLAGLRLYSTGNHLPGRVQILQAAFELVLLILVFDRLLPQILFARTRGLWIARISFVLQALFVLILPITLLLGLMLSIAALAEPEDPSELDHPSEAMDALLEAGEEEGILEQSDLDLVRSAVEFGDKVVREVMTPRPVIFAVPGSTTLQQFTAEIRIRAFSRVPVFSTSLDRITGIALTHDLLHVRETDAAQRTVASIERPVAFVPETKKVAELLREMQREKQHMRIVIDEYGGVAGLVTIEDLLEAIVGNIADEHDEHEPDDQPIQEPGGAYVVSGAFEVSRLRELFRGQLSNPAPPPLQSGASANIAPPQPLSAHPEAIAPPVRTQPVRSQPSRAKPGSPETERERDEAAVLRLPQRYEATTLGGLVSEFAGHIPLPGEVIEAEGLRMEVLSSTDRRIDRVRVALAPPPAD